MTKITVVHTAFEDAPETVAIVTAPADYSEIGALEYAYRRTNNINGSWSRGPEIVFGGKTYVNPDYSVDVEVVAELPVSERTGETLGLRSTSVGDLMYVGNKKFKVDFSGFKEV